MVLMRDFNFDFSNKKGSQMQRSFQSFLLSHDLQQIIEVVTRVTEYSETLIDLICVNNNQRVVQWEVSDTHSSDHSIVACGLKGGGPNILNRTFEYRFYKKYNKEQIFLCCILKLTEYGVSAACLKWFGSYLSHRSLQTSAGDALSSKRNVAIGVPQWSVLGPLLFLVFINNVPLSVKYSNTFFIADDTAIYYSGKTVQKFKIR